MSSTSLIPLVRTGLPYKARPTILLRDQVGHQAQQSATQATGSVTCLQAESESGSIYGPVRLHAEVRCSTGRRAGSHG